MRGQISLLYDVNNNVTVSCPKVISFFIISDWLILVWETDKGLRRTFILEATVNYILIT